MPKCKQCKTEREKEDLYYAGVFYFCDIGCAKDYSIANIEKGRKKKEEEVKKVNTKKKRDFYDNDLKTRKNAAKKACHDYIKLRDKFELVCACCESDGLTGQIHAGHFWESGKNSYIRFHEDNIHAQRAYCNTYKGGDSGFYRQNLINKIGEERVRWLDENRNKPVKWTVEDYKFVERWYKLKIKELKND